jgi:hypothetical protein
MSMALWATAIPKPSEEGTNDVRAVVVDQNGQIAHDQICSSIEWAQGDTGAIPERGHSTATRAKYDRVYPQGWGIFWVSEPWVNETIRGAFLRCEDAEVRTFGAGPKPTSAAIPVRSAYHDLVRVVKKSADALEAMNAELAEVITGIAFWKQRAGDLEAMAGVLAAALEGIASSDGDAPWHEEKARNTLAYYTRKMADLADCEARFRRAS